MANFATASDALTAALAIVDARLTNIDINEQLELYLELINRRAVIQDAIAASGGGGGGSSITANTSVEYGAGVVTAKTQRVAIASDANSVVFASPQAVTQSGTWTVGLGVGNNAIGSITNTTFAATQSGAWNINNISGTVSLPTGASISNRQIPAFALSAINLGAANAGVLKASAGAVYSLKVTNKNAAVRYFQIVNKATTPTNADALLIVDVVAIPANATVIIDSTYFGAMGLLCSTGVAWAFSSTDTTVTLATASDVISTVGWV